MNIGSLFIHVLIYFSCLKIGLPWLQQNFNFDLLGNIDDQCAFNDCVAANF